MPIDIEDVVAAEHDKAKAFWQARAARIAASVETAGFRRMRAGDVRSIDVRKLHDRFGWRAAEPTRCAGAFYRSEDFMRLPDGERSSCRGSGTIHVEHTIPVAALTPMLSRSAWDTDGEALEAILRSSVVAAVTIRERKTMVSKGLHAATRAFDGAHPHRGLPFMRYDAAAHSPIWDVVRRRVVDPERFDWSMHELNVDQAMAWASERR